MWGIRREDMLEQNGYNGEAEKGIEGEATGNESLGPGYFYDYSVLR